MLMGERGHWQWPPTPLSSRSKVRVSTMQKDLTRGSMGGGGFSSKKSMHGQWWVSFSISHHDSCSRWPLGKLVVRPSVSSLPTRPSMVKRSRGGLCRFVNLKHRGSTKYLYHCQLVWHLSILCKWQVAVIIELHTKSKSDGVERDRLSWQVNIVHIVHKRFNGMGCNHFSSRAVFWISF